jgi:hypothetical protein
MVLYAVHTHSDMIGPGLILKGGLVTRCVSLISLFFATILVSIHCARGGGRNHCQEDEDEDDITTDSGDESDARFDYDSESSFDDDVDGDEDEQDEDME